MATQAASVPKKRWIHIIPAAFLMYTIAFMDRVNIGFAIPGIEKSLAVSATIAGLASHTGPAGTLVSHGRTGTRQFLLDVLPTRCLHHHLAHLRLDTHLD